MDTDPKMHYTDPDKIWDYLTYKNSGDLLNHEIYTKNIGDQRWKSSDPKYYRVK